MGTPLHDAVQAYVEQNPARFHMPGHKGRPIFPVGEAARWDITEVSGADSLYEANGPIAETEARYAALYNTKATLLSAGGSTLCIQTMLALATKPGGRILCARGCHTAAVNAMALLDLHPVWVYPELDQSTGLALAVNAEQIESALAECCDVTAVYITSPNYFGVLCDIASIADICHRRQLPLLVDNAHGAHLHFFSPTLHPAALGADLCCDSLHKTLPVLTGGALLHIQNESFLSQARHRMSLFGSTSPSYLTLLSIDAALPWLEGDAGQELAMTAERVSHMSSSAKGRGFLLPRGLLDPVRFALGFAATGLDAAGFSRHLTRYGIEPEYLSERFCVFLTGCHNSTEDFVRLAKAVNALTVQARPAAALPAIHTAPHPLQAVSLRAALFGTCEQMQVDCAAGRICAGIVAPCPPGVPLAMPGEILDNYLCDSLKKYGILSVNVLK